MKFLDDLSEKLKDNIVRWLILRKKDDQIITINNSLSLRESQIKNKIWYRSQPGEIQEFWSQSSCYPSSFWNKSSEAYDISKYHSSLPNRIVSLLSNIVIGDFEGIDIEDKELQDLWDLIEKDNTIFKNLYNWLTLMLVEGDGAIRIVYNPDYELPLLEYVEGLNVDFTYECGTRLKEIIFKNYYKNDEGNFTLCSIYGRGYINYRLYNSSKVEVPLDMVEETKNLKDVVFYNEKGEINKKIFLAVKCSINDSALFEGRGASVYDGRDAAFDGVDMVLSTLMDSVSLSRLRTYIPSSLLPKDSNGNILKNGKDYVNSYIKLDVGRVSTGEDANKITTVEGQIQVEKYKEAFRIYLSNAIEGLISPATLGIDEGVVTTATEIAEREKVTLFTVNNIQDALRSILEELVYKVLLSYNLIINNKIIEDNFEVNAKFGQYASPSFKETLNTIKTVVPGQCLSWEKIVDEIWGNDMSDEDKALEVERLKEINNMGSLEVNDLFTESVDTEEEPIEEEIIEEEA